MLTLSSDQLEPTPHRSFIITVFLACRKLVQQDPWLLSNWQAFVYRLTCLWFEVKDCQRTINPESQIWKHFTWSLGVMMWCNDISPVSPCFLCCPSVLLSWLQNVNALFKINLAFNYVCIHKQICQKSLWCRHHPRKSAASCSPYTDLD